MVMDQETLEEPRKRVHHPVILVRHTDIPGTSVSSQKNHRDVRYVLRISHMRNILHFWHDSPVQSDSDLRICSMFALFLPLRRLKILDPFRDHQRILLEAVHHDHILPFQLHTFDATCQNIPRMNAVPAVLYARMGSLTAHVRFPGNDNTVWLLNTCVRRA